MAPRYVDIYKPEYTVLCGCHVRKVALFIAYVSLIIAVIGIIGPLVNHQWYYALSAIILIFSCVFIIIADAKAKPRFYLAYLIVTGIYVVIKLLEILFYIVIFCEPSIVGSKDPDTTKAYCIIAIVITVFVALPNLYFWYVVKKAKNYMEKEICSGNVRRQSA